MSLFGNEPSPSDWLALLLSFHVLQLFGASWGCLLVVRFLLAIGRDRRSPACASCAYVYLSLPVLRIFGFRV